MKRLLRLLLTLLILLIIVLVTPLIGIAIACEPFGLSAPPTIPTDEAVIKAVGEIKEYVRPEDQTYLTLPEWYIVYSADEYADYVKQHPPSDFPFFRSVAQYWRSYWDVCAITKGRYPFNQGYHLTLYVIGTSFTVENGLKGIYEGTLGRLTEWLSTPLPDTAPLTPEDGYANQIAEEYGDFIHTIPWYEFPFDEKLAGLRAVRNQPGDNTLRRWERQAVVGLEYWGKSHYAGLIKGGTQATYEPEKLEILVVATGINDKMTKAFPDVQIIQAIDATRTLISITRYEAFTQVVPKLLKQGVQFSEIAGNDEIMLTAFAPIDWAYDLPDGKFLFDLPILTQPERKRIAVNVPVNKLHTVLAQLESKGIELEHLYDY